jgi:hypothetical protein
MGSCAVCKALMTELAIVRFRPPSVWIEVGGISKVKADDKSLTQRVSNRCKQEMSWHE